MPEAKPQTIQTDPNVFGAAFIAGIQAYSGISSASLSQVKEAWHVQREFLKWVASGEDVIEFNVRAARENALADKKVADAAAIVAADAARRAMSEAEMGKK